MGFNIVKISSCLKNLLTNEIKKNIVRLLFSNTNQNKSTEKT